MTTDGNLPSAGDTMKFQYEVDMRVCSRDQKNFYGTVVEVDGDDVRVKWDKYDSASWCEPSEVMPDTPEAHAYMTGLTKQVQAKVDEATASLEQAFKAWVEAASLQAGREVGASEAYYLRGNKDLDLSKFEGLCESNGWSTSSLYC